MEKKLYILIMLLLISSMSGAQHTLTGKVIDRLTSEPVPFAHVFVSGTNTGTTTDLFGNFSFEVSDNQLSKELQVTCLGFKPVLLAIEGSSSAILIKLEENIIQLSEVVVKPKSAENLLKEAFSRIFENYDTTDLVFKGHYRMTSKVDTTFVRDIESVLNIYKPKLETKGGYKKLPSDSIYIEEMHTKMNPQIDYKLRAMTDWENTPYLLGYRDFVREFAYLENSLESMIERYELKVENMILLQDRPAYVISVSPKRGKNKTFWNGKIFLDEETLAFSKIDVKSTPKMFKKLKSGLDYKLQSKINKIKYDSGAWKESVSYRSEDGKWYFSNVNSSKQFFISSKQRNMAGVPVTATVEYQTVGVSRHKYRYDSTEYLPQRSEGYWKVEHFMESKYDSAFWSEFDYQESDERTSFPSTIEKLDEVELRSYQFTKLDTLQGTLTPLRTSYDVTFYHLDVEVLPEEEMLRGSSTMTFRVEESANRIQIDLFSKMGIKKIEWNSQLLHFEREYNAVYIDFPETLTKGKIEEIKVFYSGRPVDFNPDIPMYASFLWLEDNDGNPWLQAICQGYGASGWWPNKDHLSDEPDSAKISVTVPKGLDVISNGELTNKTDLENGKVRYDWKVTYPINNYNITLNVGKYSHVSDQFDNGTSRFTLDYYLLEENDADIEKTTAIVKPMLKTYEKYFGPYPFPNDGFKIVESPHAMDHQSCVAIDSKYFQNTSESDIWSDLALEDINYALILHESAHEWWGNSVSCTDNADLWIHEAFATYAEALFIEDHYGYDVSQQYLNKMKANVLNQYAIVGKKGVNHIHYDITDMYTKGSLMLNTLRHVINNDQLWFSVLKGMQTDFKHRSINTELLIDYINQKIGSDYTYFFDQYLHTLRVPRLEIRLEKVMGIATLNYRWSDTNDDFVMPVDYQSGNKIKRLYPTSRWSKMPIDLQDSFDVNTSHFYIELDQN